MVSSVSRGQERGEESCTTTSGWGGNAVLHIAFGFRTKDSATEITITPITITAVIPEYNEELWWEVHKKVHWYLSQDERVGKFKVISAHDVMGEGYGHTLKRVIDTSDDDWILIIDSDNTYNPADVSRLVDETAFSDMVVAERRGAITASSI